ncbi:MAG TPA: hypothetical protein VN611_05605 [Patescibacteria group bacterium]|nr:hypothetical protein [Patescibacteria group bacterium]
MSTKAISVPVKPVAPAPAQAAQNSGTSLYSETMQMTKRTYPDITRDQSFWDKAVLS